MHNPEERSTSRVRVHGGPAGEFLYRRMVSEATGDLIVKATCLENSDQSLTVFLTE